MARFSGIPPIWAVVVTGLLAAPLAGYMVMLRRLQDAEKAIPGFLYGWIAYTAGLLLLAAMLKAFRVHGAWHVAGVISAGVSVATICLFGTVYA